MFVPGRPSTYVCRRRRCGLERWRRFEAAYGEVANHLSTEPDASSCEEPVGPLLGKLAGVAEDDRNGRKPDLAFGDRISHDAGPDVVELEDLRVTLLDDHRGTWDHGQLG